MQPNASLSLALFLCLFVVSSVTCIHNQRTIHYRWLPCVLPLPRSPRCGLSGLVGLHSESGCGLCSFEPLHTAEFPQKEKKM
ncbi:hypothetical protein BJ912DRAFT_485866 [Pholiota molesta]|nr:hypothetical protein BJ912DRAFT_485866 [Pholiota molesta]